MQSTALEPNVSRHKCLIYDGDPSEQLPVVVPLLVDGLHDNWRCLYLGSPAAVDMIDTALSAEGVDTSREALRGALVFSSERGHLRTGRFDPEAMIDGLCKAVDQALADGFQGLCATGDMRWELGEDDGFERLLEYEALLERLFRDKPLRGICQYHRGLVPSGALRDALLTHSAMFVGSALNRDNLFYLPPELLLEGSDAQRKQGEWMCHQILRVMKAEQERDVVLRDLERRVAERTAELQLANRYLEAFSYSVSHDLRAPLRAIAGYSTALSEDCGDKIGPEGDKHLKKIFEGVSKMSELIDGMLSLGRAVNAELRRAPVDLSGVAREAATELRAQESRRSIDVTIEPDLRADGDPALLRAVMTNLLANAFKFTRGRPQAHIHVGRYGEEGGHPVFFVRDDGAGFDMRYAARLFGAFQRLHRQQDFPGTGVGLATVERIVARHGGRIWAKSAPDQGATFFFTLPPPTSPRVIALPRIS